MSIAQDHAKVSPEWEDYNRVLDTWLADAERRKGEVYYPGKGLLPPDPKVAFHSTWNNEWVTPDLIRHYADAIGDLNPLWRDETYAQRTRWGGIIANPGILDAISITARHDRTTLPPGVMGAIAGSDRRWFEPIRPGDRLRVVDRNLGIEEKRSEGKPYRLFVETFERSYVRIQDGVTVAVALSPCIHRAAPELADPPPSTPEPYRYTDEELDAIWQQVQDEYRRGADTLYWEDVAVGDECPTVVAGPLDATDVAVFQGMTSYVGAFAVRDHMMRADLTWSRRNPLTNAWQMGDLIHLTPVNGWGITTPFGTAGQSEGVLCRMLCNWAGDDAQLRRLSTKARIPNWLGDTAWMSGAVTGKRVEDGRHLVDLEVRCTNQRGVVYQHGEATVELLARAAG